MKERKPFPTKLLLMLLLVVGIGVGIVSMTKDPEVPIQTATKEAFLSSVGKVTMQFGKLMEHVNMSKAGEPSYSVSIDPDQKAARDALMKKMFYQKGGSYFTQSRWGAKPIPYELRDFEMLPPKSLPLSQADQLNGIDKRVSCEIHVRAYRVYDPATKKWGEWNPENPPELNSITMVRSEGDWKTVKDPTRNYAVK